MLFFGERFGVADPELHFSEIDREEHLLEEAAADGGGELIRNHHGFDVLEGLFSEGDFFDGESVGFHGASDAGEFAFGSFFGFVEKSNLFYYGAGKHEVGVIAGVEHDGDGIGVIDRGFELDLKGAEFEGDASGAGRGIIFSIRGEDGLFSGVVDGEPGEFGEAGHSEDVIEALLEAFFLRAENGQDVAKEQWFGAEFIDDSVIVLLGASHSAEGVFKYIGIGHLHLGGEGGDRAEDVHGCPGVDGEGDWIALVNSRQNSGLERHAGFRRKQGQSHSRAGADGFFPTNGLPGLVGELDSQFFRGIGPGQQLVHGLQFVVSGLARLFD